ncbi:hypothetical protein FAES_3748 [Fibrella aestuarina BUZ 2]|uniref:Uncharacterized protein n=1 Tax=Fibrella aestuarina BUZ 2 TaxID=1166018 RepID=I0KCA2_9BACT|nr:hypothetical protein [Fibrella aestuarina]CCH01755.1 hypothetical protein FAES_3748 [Fibrella aestuarina BUZ 2]
MRQNNKYLQKVADELTVYQRYLIDETIELTPTQFDTFDKIDTARAWLREGYSDSQVLTMLKQSKHLADRRSREILVMAYATFAELRQSKDKDGVKFLYSELFRKAAMEALQAGEFVAFQMLLKEAAKIDGAYKDDAEVKTDEYKKPTKIKLVVKATPEKRAVQDVGYEVIKSE